MSEFERQIYADLKSTDRVSLWVAKCIDHAFGTPVSEVFFQQVSSLAICEDGSMVLDHVLQAVEPIILEAQKTAQANSEARIKAHTGKYEGKAIGLAPEQR